MSSLFSPALEKLQAQSSSSCGPVEVALPGLVFDLSSLVLYGAQAVPVRLKILLDRLYSILTPEQVQTLILMKMYKVVVTDISLIVKHFTLFFVFQVGHILHTLGWSLGDYVRGYMLQVDTRTVSIFTE